MASNKYEWFKRRDDAVADARGSFGHCKQLIIITLTHIHGHMRHAANLEVDLVRGARLRTDQFVVDDRPGLGRHATGQEAARILPDEVCNRSDHGEPPLELSERTEQILASRDWLSPMKSAS